MVGWWGALYLGGVSGCGWGWVRVSCTSQCGVLVLGPTGRVLSHALNQTGWAGMDSWRLTSGRVHALNGWVGMDAKWSGEWGSGHQMVGFTRIQSDQEGEGGQCASHLSSGSRIKSDREGGEV